MPEPAIAEVEQKALSVPARARSIEIKDNESFIRAGELLKAIKDIRREIDETFDSVIKKAHEAHKEAVGQKKKAENPLVEAEGIIKPKIASYMAEQERIRREEERRLQEEARKREEEARLAEAVHLEQIGEPEEVVQSVLEEPIAPPVIVLPKATPKVEGISSRKAWKYRPKNPLNVKREYLILDEKKIGALVRQLGPQAEEIIGKGSIEIYEDRIIASR